MTDENYESAVAGLISLERLAEEMEQFGEQAFRMKYPHPFLLLLNDPMTGEVNTDVDASDTLTEYLSNLESYVQITQALPIRKASEDTYTTRITVGRTKNNDIVLRSPKVSKLHSSFLPLESGKIYQVTDMGSVNGTWVNKVRLRSKRAQKLKDEDKVAFWRYEFQFMQLDAFVGMLRDLKKTR